MTMTMTTAAERLHAILQQVNTQTVRRLSRADLQALPGLYREAVAELAEARARQLDRGHIAALQALVLRGHTLLYAPAPTHVLADWQGILLAFPAAVRRAWRGLALCTAVCAAGGVWGAYEVQRDPSSAAVLLAGGWEQNAEESFQAHGPQRTGNPVQGVFYFTNNARVALTAYALGATLGVGTLLVLVYNGVILGATLAVVRSLGTLHGLLGFILPHSGIELTAILVAAAGGMQLADGILRPGWRSRRASFMQAARQSLPLALGAASLLILAGLVEGWISPMPWPLAVKAGIGAGLDVLLAVYLSWPAPLVHPSDQGAQPKRVLPKATLSK